MNNKELYGDLIKLCLKPKQELALLVMEQVADNCELQNRIDKAIEFAEKERKKENNIIPKDLLDQQWKNGFTSALVQIEDILKGDDEN